MKNYYITTPIYYVNDKPHIGHAYTSIACDVMARFKRLDGFNVKFATGTDEHGQKVQKSADAAKVTPQEFTDAVSQTFRDLSEDINLSNDDFIRTTEDRHKKTAQHIWSKILDNGDIYLDKYSGWYSVRDEAFYTEDELINGKAPTGAEVEWVAESSYFFRLSNYADKLLKYYADNPDFVAPSSRLNEVKSFVSNGLNDLSISRTTFDWGVKVPNDPNHVMYVWVDALVNYLTALNYPDSGEFQQFWPANLHIIGKDILRFHAIYWPAFLMSANIELPKRVFAHGWWTNEGEKISKSLGNIIDPNDLISVYGLDQMRYFMLKEVPFGNDGNFSRLSMVNRINSDLANNIGNLVQRTLTMIYKNCEGRIPVESIAIKDNSLNKIRKYIDAQKFHLALDVIIDKARDANEKIDKAAPWALRKLNTEESLIKMRIILYELAEEIRQIAMLLQPFIPDSADKILYQLGVPNNERDFINFDKALIGNREIPKPTPIFQKFDIE